MKDSPICTPEYVQVLLGVVVKQLIERMDNDKAEYISSKDEEIANLTEKVSNLEKENSDLQKKHDEAQQYNRRDNLKIIGVPYKKN